MNVPNNAFTITGTRQEWWGEGEIITSSARRTPRQHGRERNNAVRQTARSVGRDRKEIKMSAALPVQHYNGVEEGRPKRNSHGGSVQCKAWENTGRSNLPPLSSPPSVHEEEKCRCFGRRAARRARQKEISKTEIAEKAWGGYSYNTMKAREGLCG